LSVLSCSKPSRLGKGEACRKDGATPTLTASARIDVSDARVETKFDPGQMVFNFAGAGGRPAGVYFPASDGVVGSILRLQRNFWP